VTLSELDHRHSALTMSAATRAQDQRLLRNAMVIACLVHFGLLFVPLPSSTPPPPPKPPEPYLTITAAHLKPPEIEPAAPTQPVSGKRPLPIPDPDATEEMLEPEMEPTDLPYVESAPDVEIIVPPAEPPPTTGPVPEGTRGLIPPVPLAGRARPEYPPVARRAGIEGKVVLKAVIDEDGRVVSIRVLSEPPIDVGFTEAAIEAVSRWRYEPGRYGGEPVAVEMTVVVDFILN
jgi:protein TonB